VTVELGGGLVISALVPDPRRPGATRIEVDGKPLWTVGRRVSEREGLTDGMPLTDAVMQRLEEAADEEAALRTALRLLERRPFARRDLARRLVRKGHSSGAVEAALDQAGAMGLLDDLDFALQYVEIRARRGQGPRRLFRDLRGLGVEGPTAEEAIAATFPPEVDLGPQVHALAVKRASQLGDLPLPVKRRRLHAYLQRRGYDTSEVIDAVREVLGVGS
jgi:regulatory protein